MVACLTSLREASEEGGASSYVARPHDLRVYSALPDDRHPAYQLWLGEGADVEGAVPELPRPDRQQPLPAQRRAVETLLLCGVAADDTVTISRILLTDSELASTDCDDDGNSPLVIAGMCGSVEGARVLLEAKAPVHRAAIVTKCSPLAAAAASRRPGAAQVVSLFITAASAALPPRKLMSWLTATVNGPSRPSALMLAAQNGRVDAVRALVSAISAASTAAADDEASAVRASVLARTTDADGVTAVHIAATHGHADVLSLLLEELTRVGGKEEALADSAGPQICATPLDLACMWDHLDCARVLLAHKASATGFNDERLAGPLTYAVYNGNVDVVALLFEAGATSYVGLSQFSEGQPQQQQQHAPPGGMLVRQKLPPLHLAAYLGDFAIVKRFFDACPELGDRGRSDSYHDFTDSSPADILTRVYHLTLPYVLDVVPTTNLPDAVLAAVEERVKLDSTRVYRQLCPRSTMDRTALRKYLRSLGYEQRFGRNFVTICDVYFHRADTNKDGVISLEEFTDWFRTFALFRAKVEFYSTVDTLDIDDLEAALPKVLANLASLHRLALDKSGKIGTRGSGQDSERAIGAAAGDNDGAEAATAGFFDSVYADDAAGVVGASVGLGVDPNIVSLEGYTGLVTACSIGALSATLALLSLPNIEVDLVCPGGETAALAAAYNGHASVLSALLGANHQQRKGAPRGAGSNSSLPSAAAPASSSSSSNAVVADCSIGLPPLQQTPLLVAVQHNHLECVRVLLQAPATAKVDRSAADRDGMIPLFVAVCQGNLAAAKLLLEEGQKGCQRPEQINAVNADGASALHLACCHAPAAVVEYLVPWYASEGGSALNIRTTGGRRAGQTALDMAVLRGSKRLVSALVSAGARQGATNVGDNTLVHVALYLGSLDVVSVLADCGQLKDALNTRNAFGYSPADVLQAHYHVSWDEGVGENPLLGTGKGTAQEFFDRNTVDEAARSAFDQFAKLHRNARIVGKDGLKAFLMSQPQFPLCSGRFVHSRDFELYTELEFQRLILRDAGLGAPQASFVHWYRKFFKLQRAVQMATSSLPPPLPRTEVPELVVASAVRTAVVAARGRRPTATDGDGPGANEVDDDASIVASLDAPVVAKLTAASDAPLSDQVLRCIAEDNAPSLLSALRESGSSVLSSVAAGTSTPPHEESMSLLCATAFCGSTRSVQVICNLLARSQGDWGATASSDGSTALMHACVSGNSALVTAILARVPPSVVNATAKNGASALFLASQHGHTAVVELLLGVSGVDVNAVGARQSSNSPDHRSAPSRRPVDATPLFVACENGHTAVVTTLLRGGAAGVNIERGRDGVTPLHAAVRGCWPDIVEMLLTESARTATAAANGFSPLLEAVVAGDARQVELLISVGRARQRTLSDYRLGNAEEVEGEAQVQSQSQSDAEALTTAAVAVATADSADVSSAAQVRRPFGASFGLTEIMVATVALELDAVELLAESGGADAQARSVFGHTWDEICTQLHAGMTWEELSIVRHTIDFDASDVEALTEQGSQVFATFHNSGRGDDDDDLSKSEFGCFLCSESATGGLTLKRVLGSYFPAFVDIVWLQYQTYCPPLPHPSPSHATDDDDNNTTTTTTTNDNNDTRKKRRFGAWYASKFHQKLEVLYATNGRPTAAPDVAGLVECAESDDHLRVREYVEDRRTPVDERLDGFTALMYAASCGAARSVEELLRLGADPLLRGADESSVLQLGVLNCSASTVSSIVDFLRVLLSSREAGGAANGGRGRDAQVFGPIDAVEEWLDGAGGTNSSAASPSSPSPLLAELQYAVSTAGGDTALHFAAQRGDSAIATLLVRAGAAVDTVNSFNHTPLSIAIAGCHYGLALALREVYCSDDVVNTAVAAEADREDVWRRALGNADVTSGLAPAALAVSNYLAPPPQTVAGTGSSAASASAIQQWEADRDALLEVVITDSANAAPQAVPVSVLEDTLVLAFRVGIPQLVRAAYSQLRADSVDLDTPAKLPLPLAPPPGESPDRLPLSEAARCVLCGRFDLLAVMVETEGPEWARELFHASAGPTWPSARKLSQRLFAFPLEYGLALAKARALPSGHDDILVSVPDAVERLATVFHERSGGGGGGAGGGGDAVDADAAEGVTTVRQRVKRVLAAGMEEYGRVTLVHAYEDQIFALVEVLGEQLLRRCAGVTAGDLDNASTEVAVSTGVLEAWLLADVVPCLALHRKFGRVTPALLTHLSRDAAGGAEGGVTTTTSPVAVDGVLAFLRSIGATGMTPSESAFFLAVENNAFGEVAELLLRSGPATAMAPPLGDGAVAGVVGAEDVAAATAGSTALSINATNDDTYSALMLAASFGNNETLQVLLSLNADLTLVAARDNTTAILLAAASGNTGGLRMLLQAAQEQAGPGQGGAAALRELVDCEASPGQSAIYFAAQDGHAECVALLLDFNAAFDLRTPEGDSPLTIAAAQGHRRVVHLLLTEARVPLSVVSGSKATTAEEDAEFAAAFVDQDAELLLDQALKSGDAFLRTVVLQAAPSAFDEVVRRNPATAMMAFGAAVDAGDADLLGFVLSSDVARQEVGVWIARVLELHLFCCTVSQCNQRAIHPAWSWLRTTVH